MNKFTKLILTTAVFVTSGFATTNTIEGSMTWDAGTFPSIANGHTTTITKGAITNYTNFVIKDYQDGNTATVILDKSSDPAGDFVNGAKLDELSNLSQVVQDAGFSGIKEYNITFGSVGDGISFQNQSGNSITIPNADLSFNLPSSDWYHNSTGNILNIVSTNSAIENETVKLSGGLYASLATLKTEGKTYLPRDIEINTSGLSGDFENVTVPVVIKSDQNYVFVQTLSGNFPNAEVTLSDNVEMSIGTETPFNFKINKSLTIKNGSKIRINNGHTLTLSPGAKLYL
ncbi:MAG: hypothetical protein Q4E61_03510 [Alphaproteobacteria bacterium]|nr:hypothetical protein [Alphaproteobacteria bacterium]